MRDERRKDPCTVFYRTWAWLVLFCDAVQEEEQSVGDVYLLNTGIEVERYKVEHWETVVETFFDALGNHVVSDAAERLE